jgi:ribosomal protein L7/L12
VSVTIVRSIAQLTVQEFNEFRKLLQAKLGMTIVVGDIPEILYEVWLTARSECKIQAIKCLRETLGPAFGQVVEHPRWGLRESKDAIDQLPVREEGGYSYGNAVRVEEGLSFAEAQATAYALRSGGHLEADVRPGI